MLSFDKPWTDFIAEVSAEYQNATVTFIDPNLVEYGDYDVATGEEELTGDPEFWTGPARIIPMRSAVNRENTDIGNAYSLKYFRVQIGKNEHWGDEMTPEYFLKRGITMRVDSCEDNPALTQLVFRSSSMDSGSHMASRTFEFYTDSDSKFEGEPEEEEEGEP